MESPEISLHVYGQLIYDKGVRPETIKLLKENIGSKVLDMYFGDDFLNLIPKAIATHAKINKWDHIKLKTFCTVNYQKSEKATYLMEKIFVIIYLIRN